MIQVHDWDMLKWVLLEFRIRVDIVVAINKPCPGNPSGRHTEHGSATGKHHKCIHCGLEWIDSLGVFGKNQ